MAKIRSMLAFIVSVMAFPGPVSGGPSEYPREHIYDTEVYAGDALVNVGIASSRWPDCTTLESAIGDIFRLEGVAQGSDQAKALALWKWFRILMSATGGSYAYEGAPGSERLCSDPHKIFTVYGHHQCDGLSWAMVALWRAAGYMALDECTWGHTTAALRYTDDDGQARYHSFDPQRRYYHWDPRTGRVATRTLPVMRGMVHRHLTAPQHLHSLRTSLRIGETRERRWNNEGRIVPSGKDKREAEQGNYYAYTPGKVRGIYAAVGEEIQTLVIDTRSGSYKKQLHRESAHAACSPPAPGKATLHPASKNQIASFAYRLGPPYVVADAWCEATLLKGAPGDTCRLSHSRDGKTWHVFHEKEAVGEETVRRNIGKDAWINGLPSVYTAYSFLVKAEFATSGDVRQVGLQNLTIRVHRMLNKRALPHLRPGENVIAVTADTISNGNTEDPGLELEMAWRLEGELHREIRFIRRFPHSFKITLPQYAEVLRDNYDQHWNEGSLQMESLRMRLLEKGEESPSLDAAEVKKAFLAPSPHPAEMPGKHPSPRSEIDVRETSGFFPQKSGALRDAEAMKILMEKLRGGSAEERWLAAEDLGNYPEALDVLLEVFPSADIDLTLFLCKALAQIKNPKARGPLLEKWRRAPRGAPGTRYIPDVLAAIGDRSVVQELIAPLKRCRFDYRFHIAHALGILGGPEAEKALRDLAANDPFPAVRKEAGKALEALSK